MLPEVGGEVMQSVVVGELCADTGTSLANHEDPQSPLIKKEDMWTPEDFLESTLHVHEDKGFLEDYSLQALNNHLASNSITPVQKTAKPRTRRKNQWKLKFHHQALPPEYLDHYEASLNKTRTMAEKAQDKANNKNATSTNAHAEQKPSTPLSLSNLPNESIHNWLQRITHIQNEIQKNNISLTNYPNIAPAIPPQVRNVDTERRRKNQHNNQGHSSNKVVNYQDLPYMGEMTLNNSKPRRGRKPKKADICHLIYKNYGTIFPGTPTHLVDERVPQAGGSGLDKTFHMKIEKSDRHDGSINHNRSKTDLQNRIISSLLEKRLSQESKKPQDSKHRKIKVCDVDAAHLSKLSPILKTEMDAEEPLNLCLRDLNNLKIRVHRKYGNIYETSTASSFTNEKSDIDYMSPINNVPDLSPSVILKVESASPTPKMNVPEFNKVLQDASSTDSLSTTPETPPLPGYVYWPSAGVFVHPMALQSQMMYYQKLASNNNYAIPLTEDSSESTMPSTPSSVDSESVMSSFQKTGVKDAKRNIVPKQISELMDPTFLSSSNSMSNETGESLNRESIMDQQKLKRLAPQSSLGIGNAKRKRSAIFIPPLPTENSTNPTTEVSICKFKFTGGAKPSLQEKKMLSVDSGGNFRYYSGTGDKANRGYEFFPRESIQQPAGSEQASNSGLFLNASGEKIDSITPSAIKKDDSLYSKVQSLPSTSVIKSTSSNESETSRRKRKSRKSMQREKLEQTFKEKGFLIQTQQLESAEGATYCKFRQLRKFTRYLFRSWKDYLPENLQNEEGNLRDDSKPALGETPSEGQWS